MYLPKHFQNEDADQIRQFLQQHYFGLLLSNSPDLFYTPLPFMFDWQEQQLTAFCHIARNNPQLKQLNELKLICFLLNYTVIIGPNVQLSGELITLNVIIIG